MLLSVLTVVVSTVAVWAEPVMAAPAAPAKVCADEAATEAGAEEMARACQRRVEDTTGRSETGTVYVNPDGTRTMEMSATVQRVRRPGCPQATAERQQQVVTGCSGA
jgi:hypothetical protein